MRLLDRLESRFGRFAIPGLVTAVAFLQLLTFFIFLFLSKEGQVAYLGLLILDGQRVMQGEIWRLVSFIFVPGSLNILFVVITLTFMTWCARGLEQAWGNFRLNLYFLAIIVFMAAGSLVFGYYATGFLLFSSLLLAFAIIYPNEEVLLFFVVPAKIKWVAWLDVATLVIMVMQEELPFSAVLCAHLNFLIVFGPGILKERVHMAKVADRRSRYEEATHPGAAFFHQCIVCKKTEVDDPTLDFRVNDEGDEICSNCRKR